MEPPSTCDAMTIKNVLQYVQGALNIMDSDAVDSINDTAESMQVANLFADIYDELMHRQEWDFLKGPVALQALVDVTNPTALSIPNDVAYVTAVWYNIDTTGLAPNRRKLVYVDPIEYLEKYGSGFPAPNRQLITVTKGAEGAQIQFYVRNDTPPTHYTSFDDETLVCDSFDGTVDTTLVSTKVSAFGVTNPQFQIEDEFVPFIPEHMVPLLQHSLNAAASLIYKQQASAPDEKRVARQTASARRKESRTARTHYYANAFGRRQYSASSERLLNNALRQGA